MDLTVVYNRQIDDQTLTLVPSGWTYENTFVLYDRETGTLWYPLEGGLMGIQGMHFKRWLREIPSDDTKWTDWVKGYPHSKILR